MVVIRARQPADLANCAAILREVHEKDGYPMYWPADPQDWLSRGDELGAWVAIGAGEEIVGHVQVRGEKHASTATLSRFFVSVNDRGTGAATALLTVATDWAQEQQRTLSLEVIAEHTHAVAFYERNGWRRTHSGPGSWLTPAGDRVFVHHYCR